MDNALFLTSPMPPSVNHYLGWRGAIKNGKPMVMSYQTAESKKYKSNFSKYLKEQILSHDWDIELDRFQHFYVDCVFYFDRIDKDCNNYFKCLLDCITDTQLIWKDDNVVCERVNRIYYDSSDPRIELTIYPVDYIGIFNNRTELDKFISNCVQCTKYKNGKCSVLNKAKEGRIQSEVSNNICDKFKQVKTGD